eukprot:1161190-Pelagomonas_calceolata.AAC.3
MHKAGVSVHQGSLHTGARQPSACYSCERALKLAPDKLQQKYVTGRRLKATAAVGWNDQKCKHHTAKSTGKGLSSTAAVWLVHSFLRS